MAWRRPSRKATPSATAIGAPSKRLESDVVEVLDGLEEEVEVDHRLGLAVGAGADEREVREVAREAVQLADGRAQAGELAVLERDVAAAALARGVAARVAAAEHVAAGGVADVHVVRDAGLLERVEVAVDGREVRLGAAGERLGAHRAFGGEQRVDHLAAGGRDAQAAGTEGAERGGRAWAGAVARRSASRTCGGSPSGRAAPARPGRSTLRSGREIGSCELPRGLEREHHADADDHQRARRRAAR